MVAHDALPGFAVTICRNDGEAIQEHDNARYRPTIKESRSTVAAAYIISEVGQDFSIKLSLKPEFEMRTEGIFVDISIDGMLIQGRFFRKSVFEEKGRNLESTVRGVEMGRGEEAVMRPFRFTNLITTDEVDGMQSLSKKDLEKSGIVIRVFKATILANPNEEVVNEYFRDDIKDKVINEVLVKGQDSIHTFGYGQVEKARPFPVVTLRKIGIYPIMIFKFLYSSEERLRLIRAMSSPTPEKVQKEIKPEPVEVDEEGRSMFGIPNTQHTSIDIDSMSPLQQMKLLKDLKDKLQIGRKPVSPSVSPTARRTGVKKPGYIPRERLTSNIPRARKPPGPSPSNHPHRIIKENGTNAIDLTED